MTADDAFYEWRSSAQLLLKLRVQPRASCTEITGVVDGYLGIRLQAPPIDGKANKALIAVLAKHFQVPKARICIKSGGKGRLKRVLIESPRSLPEYIRRSDAAAN